MKSGLKYLMLVLLVGCALATTNSYNADGRDWIDEHCQTGKSIFN